MTRWPAAAGHRGSCNAAFVAVLEPARSWPLAWAVSQCYDSLGDEMTELARSVETHRALAHPARQRLVAMLRDGELCVCQLMTVLELAASTVSAHLAELKRAGLLLESKKGRFVIYRWSDDAEAKALLSDLTARIGKDQQVVADAKLVRALRRVGVEELCRVDLDLARVGIRRPTAAR